jgi:hypothetical protein
MGLISRFIQLDRFGALFALFIHGSDDRFKSVIGAIATITFYGFSLSYLCYLIALWSMGALLPKIISQTRYALEGHQILLSQSPFHFAIEAYGEEEYKELSPRKFFRFLTDHYYDQEYHRNDSIEYHPSCEGYDHEDNFWDLEILCVDLNDSRCKLFQPH